MNTLRIEKLAASSDNGSVMSHLDLTPAQEHKYWLDRIAALSKDQHKKEPRIIPEDCPIEQEIEIWQQKIEELSKPTQYHVEGGQSIVEIKPPRGANDDEEAEFWRLKLEAK